MGALTPPAETPVRSETSLPSAIPKCTREEALPSERLTQERHRCDFFFMPTALEQVTKEAMDLPPRQKLALAEFLLESADAAADPEAEAAWDSEIRDRIRAIDEGRVTGVAYEDVMRAAESRLVP